MYEHGEILISDTNKFSLLIVIIPNDEPDSKVTVIHSTMRDIFSYRIYLFFTWKAQSVLSFSVIAFLNVDLLWTRISGQIGKAIQACGGISCLCILQCIRDILCKWRV